MALFTKEAEQDGDEAQHITRWSLYISDEELDGLKSGQMAGVRAALPPSVILAEPHMIITLRRMPAEMAERHKATAGL